MTRSCAGCGKSFDARSARAKWCSDRCRKAAVRRGSDPDAKADTEPTDGGLVESYRKELARVDRLGTPGGQHVLVLARKMVAASETGSGVAALSRQLDVVFERAMKGTARGDKLDELTRRRQEKQARAGAG